MFVDEPTEDHAAASSLFIIPGMYSHAQINQWTGTCLLTSDIQIHIPAIRSLAIMAMVGKGLIHPSLIQA